MPQVKPYKLPLPRTGGPQPSFMHSARSTNRAFSTILIAESGGIFRVICARSVAPSSGNGHAHRLGKGKLFSWTTATQPMMPQFAQSVPYSPAIVELEEGVRMVTWLVDVKPDELQLGMPLEVVFDDVTSEGTLPKFAPA